jgi:hypothetical protein
MAGEHGAGEQGAGMQGAVERADYCSRESQMVKGGGQAGSR